MSRDAAIVVVAMVLTAVAALLTLPVGLARPKPAAPVDRSLASATRYLLGAQHDDGAWRSDVYGALRDGPSLTAHVLTALSKLAPHDERTQRGLDYLAGLVSSTGEIDAPLLMPVYTASMAAEAFIDAGRPHDAGPWLDLLLSHQMTADRGWSPADVQYGGWGYSVHIPERPQADAHARYMDANISATVYALAALRRARDAGIATVDDDAFESARKFIARCQNLAPAGGRQDHDDGGFFFTPVDPTRNKAGASSVAGGDAPERFHSYGSATADGYRALLLAGVGCDDLSVVAAKQWLIDRFDAASVPGTFNKDREVLRDAYYFYYAWSLSGCLHWCDMLQPDRLPDARSALVEQLLSRQHQDGSWTNRYTDGRENDPLVATVFAVMALERLQ